MRIFKVMISILLIGAYCLCQLVFSCAYTTWIQNNFEVSTLAPEFRSKSLLDKDLTYKNMVESFILYKFKKNPRFFLEFPEMKGEKKGKSKVFADFAGREIAFNNIKIYDDLFLISMTLDDIPFVVSLSGINSGNITVVARLEKECTAADDLFTSQNLPMLPHTEDILDVVSNKEAFFYRLGNESDAYRFSTGFLEDAGACNLAERLKTMMDQGNIFAGNGISFSLDIQDIIVDKNKSVEYMAWTIIDQLFLHVAPELFPYVWQDLREAFFSYSQDPENFSFDDFSGLMEMILKIEHKLAFSANEGYIRFSPVSYKWTINSESVSEPCRQAVKEKIIGIFNKVAEEEAKTYNQYYKNIKLIPSSVPGSKNRIRFEKLSERILPAARANADGTITVNEQFVDTMAYLRQKYFDKKPSDSLFNFYGYKRFGKTLSVFESIIYSVAIHEIRGHFKFEDNHFVFNPDEKDAQRQRGIRYLYPNILSMMYFWFAVCEFGGSFKEERIKVFMKDYPELFEFLNSREKKYLPRDLMAINDECEKYGFNAYQLAKAVIPTAGMTLEFLWGHEEGLTFKDLVSSFNFGLRNISGEKCLLDSLGLLMDTGLVNNIGAEAAPVYKAVPMTSNEAEIIKDIFEKNIEDEKKVKQAVLAYVFKTTETKWGTKLLNTIRQTAKMMTAKKRGKVVLIYDNKWVPEEQRNLREFQSLERRVIKAIEGLDNIEVVRSSDENVVDEIKKRARIPLENFIVVAQKNVFDLPEIARMLPESKMDKHKIFCVAMETEEMSDDSYIHLVEIFSMVFAAYADKLFYIDHPGVEHIEVICGKYYCFTPCADKLGLDRIRDIYIRQAEFLANA